MRALLPGYRLLDNEGMPLVGSLDVDLDLDTAALGDGQYATLIDARV